MLPPVINSSVASAESDRGLADERARLVKQAAIDAGFSLVGIAAAVEPTGFSRLQSWIQAGFAGEMRYIPRREAAYAHPRGVMATVASVVMTGWSYHTPIDMENGQPRVASYAQGPADYHDVLRERLNVVADVLHKAVPGSRTRICVDTAPLLERDFARLAGLGWFGKNTMLINKRAGSEILLAGLLTDIVLTPDAPHATSHCGTCTRCLEACPTDAFPEPGVLDARRCISYLTIEQKAMPDPALRPLMSDWLFGCDVCQDVCPWNRKATIAHRPELRPMEGWSALDAAELLALDETTFKARFGTTPLERPGRAGIGRNAAIWLGNNGSAGDVSVLTTALSSDVELIRSAAAWGLGRLAERFPAVRAEVIGIVQERLSSEVHPEVRQELERVQAQSTNENFVEQ